MNLDNRETINIGNIAKGCVPEVFEHAMQQVLKNIADINTSATQKRQITLKFTFKPSESREVGEVTFQCEEHGPRIERSKTSHQNRVAHFHLE